ncbi:MAG: LytTR family DNA-binding domain-containing protein, partial [Daejeonella sp.]|uniref:LytR/AlgR family response regulator transcription factor n=1 Tax=Daejeonella sp. TaxID=2805397 RepID=UPI003C7358A8
DEPDSIDIITDYIEQTPNLKLVHSTTDPRDILSVIKKPGLPKITFLDIEMPGLNGLEVAGLINSHTAIIFITSHTEHAVEAFEKDAFDYLIKPVSYSRFLKAVLKVQSRIQNGVESPGQEDNYYYIKGNLGELIKIRINEILYIESLLNYVRIYTIDNVHTTYLTLKECEFKLNGKKFLKVHKSYVVNLERIVKNANNELTMENKEKLPIGAAQRAELMVRLKNRIFSSGRRKTWD